MFPQHHAQVASKLHEDYKISCTDYLGKARLLGTGERGLPAGHTFGLHSLRHGVQAGVGELFRTGYTQDQLQPDADLGKSLREGYRNLGPDKRVSVFVRVWVLGGLPVDRVAVV